MIDTDTLPPLASSSSSSSSSSSLSAPHELRILITPNEQGHKRDDLADIIQKTSELRAELYQLTCGDYAIVSGPRSAKPGECAVVALVERKTRSDLESSIMDGRYKEQAARLLLSGARFIYIYVTPGPLWERSNEQAVHTAILHLQSEYAACAARDGGRVFQVLCSECDTPARLGRDLGTLARYITAAQQSSADSQALLLAAAMQNGAKKKCEEQADVFPAQLGVITGMSFPKAKAVARVYPSMRSLLKLYTERGRRPPPPPAPKIGSRKRKADSSGDVSDLYIVTMKDRLDSMDSALQDVEIKPGTRLGPALSRKIRRALVPDTEVAKMCV